jgi:hypothetical protein
MRDNLVSKTPTTYSNYKSITQGCKQFYNFFHLGIKYLDVLKKKTNKHSMP